MKRFVVILFLLAAVGAGAYATWWYKFRKVPTNELVLYGNVDLRQVELPFPRYPKRPTSRGSRLLQ